MLMSRGSLSIFFSNTTTLVLPGAALLVLPVIGQAFGKIRARIWEDDGAIAVAGMIVARENFNAEFAERERLKALLNLKIEGLVEFKALLRSLKVPTPRSPAGTFA